MDWFGARVDGPMVVIRAIHFAACAVVAGSLTFRAVVARPALRSERSAGKFVRAQSLQIASIGMAIAVTSGVIWLLLQAVSMSGLPPGEAGYLPGSFWLAQALAAAGRMEEARRVYTALLGLRNDVGLLAEGYDPLRRRFAGNHPLAGSHIALIMTARALTQNGQFARSG